MGDSIHSSHKATSVISGRFGGQCLSALGKWLLLHFLIGCHVRSFTPRKTTLIDSLPKKNTIQISYPWKHHGILEIM